MSDHVYKVVDLVGSSRDGIEPAINNAISRASETLRNLDWFEVKEVRGNVENGKVGWYQVGIRLGFRVLDASDLQRGG
jgi:flavin-binding protein dodecin